MQSELLNGSVPSTRIDLPGTVRPSRVDFRVNVLDLRHAQMWLPLHEPVDESNAEEAIPSNDRMKYRRVAVNLHLPFHVHEDRTTELEVPSIQACKCTPTTLTLQRWAVSECKVLDSQ
jgi:hypothetical protein